MFNVDLNNFVIIIVSTRTFNTVQEEVVVVNNFIIRDLLVLYTEYLLKDTNDLPTRIDDNDGFDVNIYNIYIYMDFEYNLSV